jgi:hypothetical protein
MGRTMCNKGVSLREMLPVGCLVPAMSEMEAFTEM